MTDIIGVVETTEITGRIFGAISQRVPDASVGTAQLMDGAVTAAKMDASLPTTPITNAEIDAVTQA